MGQICTQRGCSVAEIALRHAAGITVRLLAACAWDLKKKAIVCSLSAEHIHSLHSMVLVATVTVLIWFILISFRLATGRPPTLSIGATACYRADTVATVLHAQASRLRIRGAACYRSDALGTMLRA